MVRNVHERMVAAPIERVGPLLDRLGGSRDVLWPTPAWQPMVLDGPVAVGAAGGHGSIRYQITAHEPGRKVEAAFVPGQGIDGWLAFTAEPVGSERTLLRVVAQARFSGAMVVAWPLAVRWAHDAVLEELFDNAQRVVGDEPERPVRRSPWVRLMRLMEPPRAHAVEVPGSLPLADTFPRVGFPRVDWTDVQALPLLPGMPQDPRDWADAVFGEPPGWVAVAFGTLSRCEGEVLLGRDGRHLGLHTSVRREAERVLISTEVKVRTLRGRAYLSLLRPVYPAVVRAMLNRAARRLSGSFSPLLPRP